MLDNRERGLASSSLASRDQRAVSQRAARGKAGWKKGAWGEIVAHGSAVHLRTPGLVCQGTPEGGTGAGTGTARGPPLWRGADGTTADGMKMGDQICQDRVTSRTEVREARQKACAQPPASPDLSRSPENISRRGKAPRGSHVRSINGSTPR